MILYAIKHVLNESFYSINREFCEFGGSIKLYKTEKNATKQMNKMIDSTLRDRFYLYCKIENITPEISKTNEYINSHRKKCGLQVVKVKLEEMEDCK